MDTQLRPPLLMKECRVELELQQRQRLKSGSTTERESHEVNRTEQYPDGELRRVGTGRDLHAPQLHPCLLSRTGRVFIDHICANAGFFVFFFPHVLWVAGQGAWRRFPVNLSRVTHWISRRFALVRENSPRM